ncbi:MAG TPA: hypothetical protein ENN19_13580 [Chloroflexi bacterium]|nr:hypothetical protein [Chloroflexota bacterium]
MHLGTNSVIELQPQDDFASIRYRLRLLGRGRVILSVPWEMHFLSNPVDFDLLRREAGRYQMEAAIVSPDPARRQLARGCGFPAFSTVERAQRSTVWRGGSPEKVEPPPRHWWDAEVRLQPRAVRPLPRWVDWLKLGFRFLIFILVLAVLAASAYTIVPAGTVTLVPAGEEFSTIVPVSVDLDIESLDNQAGLIPARRLGVEVSGYAEAETTGLMDVVAGRATGTVLFTNLLAQDYTVRAGTVVRTSSTSYPIRFRTTADVVVPAGGQATVSIEGLQEGVGNVGAFQINRAEGAAASAVRVINPEPTQGADAQERRVVIRDDYDRVWRLLIDRLFDQAYTEMGYLLEPTEMLLRESMRIEAVPKESYNRFLTEQAETVGLDMEILVSGWAVDVDNAKNVAYARLSRQLPPGYSLIDARFQVGEMAEEDVGPGKFTFFVTASGYAAISLNTDKAVELVKGQPVEVARRRLLDAFPLAEPPRLALWPRWSGRLAWLDRMPLLPLRIDVRVVPKEQEQEPVTGQATSLP